MGQKLMRRLRGLRVFARFVKTEALAYMNNSPIKSWDKSELFLLFQKRKKSECCQNGMDFHCIALSRYGLRHTVRVHCMGSISAVRTGLSAGHYRLSTHLASISYFNYWT